MNSFEIRFQEPLLLTLAAVAAAALVWSHMRLPKPIRRGLSSRVGLVLRMLGAWLLALVIAGTSIISNQADTALIVLADRSYSMTPAADSLMAAAQELVDKAVADGMYVAAYSFASESQQERALSRSAAPLQWNAQLTSDASNLQAALEGALQDVPENMRKRVVLLTDGNATDGDALSGAKVLDAHGARLDAIAFDTQADAPEMEVTGIVVPDNVALGQSVSISVQVQSNTDGRGELRIYDEETLIKQTAVGIFPGDNSFTYKITPKNAGARLYRAEVDLPSDTQTANNHTARVVHVGSQSAVLIVEGEPGQSEALRALLLENNCDVTCVAAKDLPTSPSKLCAYGLVILMNVANHALPIGSAGVLNDYVTIYGRSVLTTGGANTYLLGGMQETEFEEFLPIHMRVEDKESAEPAALLLLIDNSASMEGTAITMTKRGAIKSIQALNENDYVGVITFSSEYGVLSELTAMKNKDEVIAAVSELGTVMGTIYSGALQEAYNELVAFEKSQRKHVLLLSDGNPSDTHFDAVLQKMADAGITVSTIAVGRNVNADLMQRIASIGGGRCYLVESSYDLPSIMMTDTVLLQVDYECNEVFAPSIARQTFFNASSLPALGGYIRASAKPATDVLLTTPDDRPLYVRWACGTGMAGSFMSDLSGEWSQQWFANEAARQAIWGMVNDLLPSAYSQGAVSLSLAYGGSEGVLSVHSADAPEGTTFTALVTPPQGESYTAALQRMDEGVYEQVIPLSGEGKYAVTLNTHFADGAQETWDTAVAVAWSPEYEAFSGRLHSTATLDELCTAAGLSLIHI